jgi:hypothetical protein
MKSPPIGGREAIPRLDGESLRLWTAAKVNLHTMVTDEVWESSDNMM